MIYLCSPPANQGLFSPFSLLAPGRLLWCLQIRRRRMGAGSRSHKVWSLHRGMSNRATPSQPEMWLFSPSVLRSWYLLNFSTQEASRQPPPPHPPHPRSGKASHGLRSRRLTGDIANVQCPQVFPPGWPVTLLQHRENEWHFDFPKSKVSWCPESLSSLCPKSPDEAERTLS